MKKLLLFFVANMISFLLISVNAQQVLELTIVETTVDDGVSISFDDGEYENDSIDKVDDDDLDMGWEGDDLNIMTAYTRFRNVTLPKGAIIDSAFLKIYAHEDEYDEAIVKIYAEANDNSSEFSEDEALDDRTYTTSYVDWDITEEWTMWEAYSTPDIKTVIQEVIDRDGWQYGNALTLFLKGEDQGASELDNARDFESYENIEDPEDGGDGLHHPERIPKLVIYYTATSPVELAIVQTHVDDGVYISFDDGEYENDSIDKVDDDDLDMGWEGDDLNIMTAYTRFQNVPIPAGASIDSAFINLYAHEDEYDEAIIKIYAEAVDSSVSFTETEALDDRTYTTTYVDWDITEEWTMWEAYSSPDIKTVIQEVVDRDGWKAGNALTVFMKGEDQGASELDNARDFESFENIEDPEDGGDGLFHLERVPKLKIYFSTTTTAVKSVTISSFNIYPNPSDKGYINIGLSSSNPSEINIYNITGVLVKNIDNVKTDYVKVDVSSLKSGIYFVNVKQNNTSVTQKIILE